MIVSKPPPPPSSSSSSLFLLVGSTGLIGRGLNSFSRSFFDNSCTKKYNLNGNVDDGKKNYKFNKKYILTGVCLNSFSSFSSRKCIGSNNDNIYDHKRIMYSRNIYCCDSKFQQTHKKIFYFLHRRNNEACISTSEKKSSVSSTEELLSPCISSLSSSSSSLQPLSFPPEKTKKFVSIGLKTFSTKYDTPLRIPLRDYSGFELGTVFLPPAIFGTCIRRDIIHRVVVWQLAKRRLGTSKSKTLSEVSGSGKKPHAQKGSGRARAGQKRRPQARGGYKPHGPKPKDWSYTLQKKVRKFAMRSVLSAKLSEGNLVILNDVDIPTQKTREILEKFKANNWTSALIVDGKRVGEKIEQATSNVHFIDVIPVRGLNVYDILRREKLILSLASLPHIIKVFAPNILPTFENMKNRCLQIGKINVKSTKYLKEMEG